METSLQLCSVLVQVNSGRKAPEQDPAIVLEIQASLRTMAERIVRRLHIRDPHAVDDLVQRAWVALADANSTSRYDPKKGKPGAFTWGVLLNLGRTLVREDKRGRHESRGYIQRVDVAEHPLDAVSRAEALETLKLGIKRLSVNEQELLAKRFGQLFGGLVVDGKWTDRDAVQLCRLLKILRASMDSFA